MVCLQPVLQVGCPLCSRLMHIKLARINQQKSSYPGVDPTLIKVVMASVLQQLNFHTAAKLITSQCGQDTSPVLGEDSRPNLHV